MNNGGVCRTAPATPSLLDMYILLAALSSSISAVVLDHYEDLYEELYEPLCKDLCVLPQNSFTKKKIKQKKFLDSYI